VSGTSKNVLVYKCLLLVLQVAECHLFQSKGGILQKACDYIRELQQTNSLMAERVKVADEMSAELETLRQQCEDLRQENDVLRELLQQHGIDPPTLQTTDDTDGL
jgi:Tfp pilus assembly protein PilN